MKMQTVCFYKYGLKTFNQSIYLIQNGLTAIYSDTNTTKMKRNSS